MEPDMIRWHRVPELPDMIRSTDWGLIIRRVYDDQGAGCTMYQLFDSSPMLDQDAPLKDRTAWQLVGWFPDSHAAREAAQEYRTDAQNRATSD